ncbi:hypothetical protein GQ55_1G126400 [Panicum hallii var. hallii]|uniref:Uncharacterized protein n=1 Tax=Panicum hallii var. hallii TaxID=1504633 RepID=A0A2T7F511_9POAL|nr:hypothetical protein GQ55_1G126400 [Panicum hallii var. hallii]
MMRTAQPYVTQVHWLHQRVHQVQLKLRLKRLHRAKPWIHPHKHTKDQLCAAVQSYSNKRCMLSSLGYILILMRVIYCLSRVLSCYLGLRRRLQHWVTSRMLRVTPRTRRLMPRGERVTRQNPGYRARHQEWKKGQEELVMSQTFDAPPNTQTQGESSQAAAAPKSPR